MAWILFVAYILIFILQIVLLAVSMRKKKKKLWIGLFLTEVLSLLFAVGLMIYYDNLPDYGMMPALTYFGKGIFSFCAAGIYAVVLFGSVCSYFISTKEYCVD